MHQSRIYPQHRHPLQAAVRTILLALPFLGSAAAFAADTANTTELVSKVYPRKASDTASGSVANLILPAPSISANGRWVAFLSSANNLVPGQTRTDPSTVTQDLYLHDRVSGATALVSHSIASPTTTSDRGAEQAALSADGRWIAFISRASDLTAEQTEHGFQIEPPELFLFDSTSGTTVRIGASVFGQGTNIVGVREVAISADGGFVAFASDAPDVFPGQQDGNRGQDVFLYDRAAARISLVSHTSGSLTSTGNQASQGLSLSADGRFVAFFGSATDLVPGQQGTFLYDRLSGSIRWIGLGGTPKISADGGTIAFLSDVNVIPGQVDTNGGSDVFLFDVAAGTTVLASHVQGSPATTADAPSSFGFGQGPFLSADGRFVVFESKARNLVPGQGIPPSPGLALFLYDKQSGAVTLVSRADGSASTPPSYGDSTMPSLSADGRLIAFQSEGSNLVPNQAGLPTTNVFLFDRGTGATSPLSLGPAPSFAFNFSQVPAISADGSQAAFLTTADNLVAGIKDFNNGEDVILYDTATKSSTYATLHAPGEVSATPDAQSALRGLSADGRFVLYESAAVNLVAGQMDVNVATDVFLRDRTAGTNLLVSRAASGPAVAGNNSSSQSALSADGRYVAFASVATNLVTGVTDRPIQDPVPGQPLNYLDIFLFDRTTGLTTLMSRSADTPGLSAFGPSDSPSLSADGRYVAFVSSATDLVLGFDDADGIGVGDVYLYDRINRTVTLVSHSSASLSRTAGGPSFKPSVSADGNFVIYESEGSDLVPGQSGSSGFARNVFVYDRATGANRLVSHTPGALADGGTGAVGGTSSVSADGRYIVFASGNQNLAAGADAGFVQTYYLYDRVSGTLTIAGGSYRRELAPPALSADGRRIVFLSNAPLVPGVSSAFDQVYLYDRVTQITALVTASVLAPGSGEQGIAESVTISGDGRFVAFISNATDLVAGQTGTGRHVFVYDRIAGTLTVDAGDKSTPVIFDNSLTPPALLSSMNGRQAAFDSYSPDLVPGDFNGKSDVFVFNLAAPPSGPVALPPCTLFKSQVLRSGVRKIVKAAGSCGVPAAAHQIVAKVTVTRGTGKGNVQFFPGNVTSPAAGILRFNAGVTRTAVFTLPLSTNGTGNLALLPFVAGNGKVHVAVEVDGYVP